MRKLRTSVVMAILALFLGLGGEAGPVLAGEKPTPVYAPIGDVTTTPSGYTQFCQTYPGDCQAGDQEARDVVLTKATWRDLGAVNDQVNRAIEPMTDLENYGREEWWAYPTNGKGDCEDYVLLKRKLLLDAGWPRSALLITVVRDKKGDGHAVLMVKTDRGEFVLDNQETRILPWQNTGYRYVKRQSQTNQNIWVSLGDTQTTAIVAAGAR
ncbi:transglutaminase-like cysteine peptidase [Labrys wisconsinensis]|uniref:Transglutaminase-like cysteine proteinase n=1 Tax=Labrys wisconsinensis TaxID=425677 RepID=A0ABU0J4H1_9HYPH|nr:transglutaminase-like cysteine peptidase [Labrys wisconsinensis]MDQ0469129.1 putative transglutaminase-like cysteine proteinase [Labrys wisconsinensis]